MAPINGARDPKQDPVPASFSLQGCSPSPDSVNTAQHRDKVLIIF